MGEKMQICVIVAVVLGLLEGSFADPLCSEVAEVACPDEVPAFPRSRMSVAPINEVLTEYCIATTPVLQCRGSYSRMCDGDEDPQSLRLLNFMNEICDQSSELRIGYNQHVSCFNRISDKFFHCTSMATEGMKYYVSQRRQFVTAVPGFESFMDCIVSRLVMNCVSRHLQQRCGADAVNAFQAIFDKFDSEIQAPNCRPEISLFLLYDMFQVITERDRQDEEASERIFRNKRSYDNLRPALENLRDIFK